MARSTLLFLMFLCAAAGGIAAPLMAIHKPPVVLESGTLLAPGRALADFNLLDHQGRRFGSTDLSGHRSLDPFSTDSLRSDIKRNVTGRA